MRNVVRFALMAIMMVTFSTAAQAKDPQSSKQHMSREQLAEAQANYIANELAFDDATTQKFKAAFVDYQKEVWALGPQAPRHRQQAETDAEAEKAIKDRFEHSKKILDIREKYYQRYSQFLTQKQIERVYELEHKAMSRLAKHGYAKKRDRAGKKASGKHPSDKQKK